MPQTYYDFNASSVGKPDLHLAVANGFPPASYHPLFDPMSDRYHVYSLPPRPLWTDPPAPTTIKHWESLADDILAGFDQFKINKTIAAGHSFGGIATMIAAVKQPERFHALILLDPTLLPKKMLFVARLARMFGMNSRNQLTQKALTRRSQFDSIDEAYTYWRGKRLFRDWSDTSVRAYTESLLKPNPDGGYELAWSTAWEARYYDTLILNGWSWAAKLKNTLPILIIRGETSNTFFENAEAGLRKLLPQADFALIKGHGHLFPHSAPDETRSLMTDWLSQQGM